MPDSIQHKLDRVRPPRVQITYDVETAGAIVTTELPFVVGIMADLGTSNKELSENMRYDTASQNGGAAPAKLADGKPAKPLAGFKERKFVNIDRDNFNDIMKSVGPRLSISVTSQKVVPDVDPNDKDPKKLKFKSAKDETATAPTKIELEFQNIKDFDPINIVKQVKLLHDLFEKRSLLSDLLTKLEGNENLEAELRKILDDGAHRQKLQSLANPGGAATADSAGDDPATAATAAANRTAQAALDAAAKATSDAVARESAAAKAKAAAEQAKTDAEAAEAKAAAARAAKVAAEATADAAAKAKDKAAQDAPKAAADAKAAADKAEKDKKN